ncbi:MULTISPECIES: hypothetical protein [unclassified Pseudomonas]|uniref:hypothetical protein n=1 Tax=unclassified Pseudomonas TaxID=196821 RepID=UPI0021158C3B|nr:MULTISPECIES: hypothetical protein [unclassified Pseudomonas]
MAARPLTGNPHIDSNIRLARELVRRPELMQALDRNGRTGELDNRLSRNDIKSYLRSDNPLKLATDKDIVLDVLRHFNALKGGVLEPFNRAEYVRKTRVATFDR